MSSFGYDPEAIIQEADIEQAEFEAQAAEARARRRRGICSHGSGLGGGRDIYSAQDIAEMRATGYFPDRSTDPLIAAGGQKAIPAGKMLCIDCGELVADPCGGRA